MRSWRCGNIDQHGGNFLIMDAAHSVFAYGTLQIPEVMERVTGLKHPAAPARLNGYQRLNIKNKSYPGIIEAPAHSVEGILYKGVSAQALAAASYSSGPSSTHSQSKLKNELRSAACASSKAL